MMQRLIDYIAAYRDGCCTIEELKSHMLICLLDLPTVEQFDAFVASIDLDRLQKEAPSK